MTLAKLNSSRRGTERYQGNDLLSLNEENVSEMMTAFKKGGNEMAGFMVWEFTGKGRAEDRDRR